jgi:hypothetical protein
VDGTEAGMWTGQRPHGIDYLTDEGFRSGRCGHVRISFAAVTDSTSTRLRVDENIMCNRTRLSGDNQREIARVHEPLWPSFGAPPVASALSPEAVRGPNSPSEHRRLPPVEPPW